MVRVDLNKALKSKKEPRLASYKWEEIRQIILERDNNKCVKCEEPGLEIDHIVAKRLGGTDEEANLQTLCNECHKAKTKEDVDKIRKLRRFKNYEKRDRRFDNG